MRAYSRDVANRGVYSLQQHFYYFRSVQFTASFKALPGLKAGTLAAGTVISPKAPRRALVTAENLKGQQTARNSAPQALERAHRL